MIPSSRDHKHSVDFEDHLSSDDGYRGHASGRPRGYRPRIYRDDSLITKDQPQLDKADSGWDTDYSPRDKYYLSESDDPHDLYSPRRSSPDKRGQTRAHSKERRGSEKHRASNRPSFSRRSPSPPKSRSHRHDRHRSTSHSRARDEEKDRTTTSRHKSTTHAKATSASHAPRSRPRPSRAASSYLTSARPRHTRAPSSYTAASSRSTRPRPVRGLSRNASHTKTRFPRDLGKLMDPDTLRDLIKEFNWDAAGKVALQAGTVAAIKVGTDSIPWPVKATKIGSAALGAAVVDHVFRPKKKGGIKYTAMRHLAEVAVGNFVVGPAMNKTNERVSSSRGGGRKR